MSMTPAIQWGNPVPAGELEAVAQASEALDKCLRKKKPNVTLQIDGESLIVPATALRLLGGILQAMASSHSVAVVPVAMEFTTQEAADLLGISRPHLIEKLDNGAIVHRKVGKHRRIPFRDLIEYKIKTDADREAPAAEGKSPRTKG